MSAHLCPVCGGERLAAHPGGLVWRHAQTCELLRAEDVTAASDHERLRSLGRFQRAATAAERELLAAAGVTLTDPAAVTVVDSLTGAVRRRRWTYQDGQPVDLDAEPTEQEPPDAA